MRSLHEIWAAQDKIALDAEEEQAIELKRDLVGDKDRVVSNPALAIPPKQYEFPNAELLRITAAIET